VLNILNNVEVDNFFHIASLTDFRNKDSIKQKLFQTNIEGTKFILNLSKVLKVKNFHYISSAYVCGENFGEISPYLINNKRFHNNYEESKLIAENHVENYCKQNNINYMIYRISTISGRLLEKPIGYINKFDVFYAWAHFFYNLRYKMGLLPDQQLTLKIRLQLSENQGMNIVPVDYAAKLIMAIANDKGFQKAEKKVHIVNNENFDHREQAKNIFELLNITGYTFTNEAPPESDRNDFEKIYYKFIGDIFDGYLNKGNMVFLTNNLNKFKNVLKTCPKIHKNNYLKLLEFAIKKQFK